MAELGDALTYGSTGEEDTIHVEMLDYGYIGACKDPKILRGIIKVLKSGREGIYPELTKAAEDKLISVLPEKERARVLKMRQQASPDEVQSAENEVDNWVRAISGIDGRLKTQGSHGSRAQGLPVRGQKREAVSAKPKSASTISAAPLPPSKDKKERLSGYDFRSWEKFDVDAAVAEVDEEDSQTAAMTAEARLQSRAAAARLADDVSAKRRELFDREMDALRIAMEVGGMSRVQTELMAAREKAKGNECFRCGEHETAFQHYSRSIALDPTLSAYFTNRAMVAIKLNKFETAEDDCSRALQLDMRLVKAWWLRGSARLHRGRCAEAILDYKSALRLEPGNRVIEDMLEKALEKYEEVEGRPYKPVIPGAVPEGLGAGDGCLFSTTDIVCVTTWDEMGLPSQFNEIAVGVMREERTTADPPSFTRIAIVDDSEDEEERRVSPLSSPTRIPITCDDSDEDENEVDEVPHVASQHEHPAGFTRIAIAEDSDENDDEALGADELAVAEQLKAEGNQRMQAGDISGALGSYSRCLELLSGRGAQKLELAVLNNRSFAHIQLSNYCEALADASVVLAAEPQNLKALYRRALAFEGCGDDASSLVDVTHLLALDSSNAVALELKGRLTRGATVVPSSPLSASSVDQSGENAILIEKTRQVAMKLLGDGEYETAIVRLEAAAGEGPAFAPLLQLLMTAYRGTGQDQKVVKCAAKILESDKNNFRAILCRSTAYFGIGNLDGAKADALSALQMDPTNSEAMGILDQIQQAEEIKSIKNSFPDKDVSDSIVCTADLATESARLKDAGNDALGKEKFDMAIALYSEALKVDSGNMAALNNRALAYLKANRFIDSERDASALLERERLEGKTPNVKALYRRGLARKNIGGKVSLLGAHEDFSTLLQIEPANKTAKSEKAKVEQLLSEMKYSSGAMSVTGTEVSKRSVGDNDGFVMTARSTTIKRRDVVQVPSTPASPQPSSNQQTSAAIPQISSGIPSAASTPPVAKSVSITTPGSGGSKRAKEPVVPTEPPRSLYELERTWRGLKIRPDLFAKYVTTFTKATFKNVFKEAMTPDLLSSILSTIRHEILVLSPETALRILGDMTSIGSFSMTMALLPAEDLDTLNGIFQGLRVHMGAGSEALGKLIKTYGVPM